MRLTKLFLAAYAFALLSGCSSVWNVGDSKYACPGMPSGVVCKTPLEVYKLTNNRNALVTMDGTGSTEAVPVPVETKMQVHLPTPISQPMPVMEAAQVMRIWIAPWIDQSGDLHYPSFIFSEVTPRRWSFGNLVKAQSAPVPVSAYIEANRDESGQPQGGVIPMAPAGVAPPLPDHKATGQGNTRSSNSANGKSNFNMPTTPKQTTSSPSPF